MGPEQFLVERIIPCLPVADEFIDKNIFPKHIGLNTLKRRYGSYGLCQVNSSSNPHKSKDQLQLLYDSSESERWNEKPTIPCRGSWLRAWCRRGQVVLGRPCSSSLTLNRRSRLFQEKKDKRICRWAARVLFDPMCFGEILLSTNSSATGRQVITRSTEPVTRNQLHRMFQQFMF
jgi:sugar (pentulose or hexulose) kinase